MRTARTSTRPAARWCRDLGAPAGCATRAGASAERATLDLRALCLLRETLAYHAGLADFAFAMQGLGSGPITLAGTRRRRQR